ncbi:MAG: hypothetical protein EON51_17915 [Acinetobacter sp.]|nr:MAG: hypothetical protein EON51_17915 [Acinetobacter sp.]
MDIDINTNIMMKYILTGLLLSICFFSCTEKKQVDANQLRRDSIRERKNYIVQVRSFIEIVNGKNQLSLNDNLNDSDYLNCIEQLKYDTSVFTQDEIAYILERSHNSALKKWTKELVPTARIINGDTIKLIFNNYDKMWPYFHKKIGKDLTTFSAPIFFRNNQYCIFYKGFHCGDRCGEGELSLYKREGKGWKKIKTYCSWIA